MNMKLTRETYIALYASNLAGLGLDKEQLARCILWDNKTRPDMICRITGRPLAVEEHIRETCWNYAVELAKGVDE